MKLTILFMLVSVCAFGQPSQKPKEASTVIGCAGCDLKLLENRFSVPFDALNGAQIQEAENAAKYAHKTDSVKWVLVRGILQVSKVDFSRISDKGDSLQITPQGIVLKLRLRKK